MTRMSAGVDNRLDNTSAPLSSGRIEPIEARAFVATPFAVRRNVVKVWRPLSSGLWFQLDKPSDWELSVKRERTAAVGVAILAIALLAGLGGVGYRETTGDVDRNFRLIGKSAVAELAIPSGAGIESVVEDGWFYAPGLSLVLVLWVLVPSLAGWMSVRWLWIPWVVRDHPQRSCALALARHLLGVYMFVYLMVLIGVALMAVLILLSPTGTETFRWCFWCFVFGESFFVPAVMWIRFVIADRNGSVFGRHRFLGLGLYTALFVVVPILGMVPQLGQAAG